METSGVAALVEDLLGTDLPIRFKFWDGGDIGPKDAPATIVVRSPDALSRIVASPGELGFARAYVAGDIALEGDIYAALNLRDRLPSVRLTPTQVLRAARLLGTGIRRLRPPSEELRLRGRLHSASRDSEAVSHHYDVSNAFYEMVLGPSMVYSCAVFETAQTSLEVAQETKLELVCKKLGLRPGMRLLDVGCGWGSMAIHAAKHHGVEVVGVTLSVEQANWACERAGREGLADSVDIRVQDYRHIADEPFDAISSIGMFEHVGIEQLGEYFERLFGLLKPGGRLLNHAISRPPGQTPGIGHKTFVGRYVFPDAALQEVGSVTTAMQAAGFEARHMESIREHYALTLRNWVQNLQDNWAKAVAEVGAPRARVWMLYMSGSVLGFEDGRIGVDQVLSVRQDHGKSGMDLRLRL